jgi:hypothetical protein
MVMTVDHELDLHLGCQIVDRPETVPMARRRLVRHQNIRLYPSQRYKILSQNSRALTKR